MWGLTAHLIKQNYSIDQIKEASSQWLHFIRPDYYVGKAIEDAGFDPEHYGFSTDSSCFTGRCDTPFYTQTSSTHLGGCGGMAELISENVN